MNDQKPSITPYPDVNQTLGLLLHSIREILGDDLVGLYLHGSLAGGDFTPGRSDIDFVAVTRHRLDKDIIIRLAEMHAALAPCMEWKGEIEGSYVPVQSIHHWDPDDCQFPALRSDGSFAVDGHGPDWIIQCHSLREKGIPLVGPDIKELIEPISADELRRASSATLLEWWAPVLGADRSRLDTAHYRSYAVLTMCRGLFTLANGRVGSKTEAARWSQAGPAASWSGMIERALAWRHGMEMDPTDDVLDLVRFTLQSLT